jgi:hypothetical protein
MNIMDFKAYINRNESRELPSNQSNIIFFFSEFCTEVKDPDVMVSLHRDEPVVWN